MRKQGITQNLSTRPVWMRNLGCGCSGGMLLALASLPRSPLMTEANAHTAGHHGSGHGSIETDVVDEPIAPDWVSTCASNEVPFESQGWWAPDFGHLHLGFCAPQGNDVKGVYTLKTHLVLHGNPGILRFLQLQIDSSDVVQTNRIELTCPDMQTCSWERTISLDTNRFPNDGWHHLRVRATVKEPDGKELIATCFIPIYLRNGKTPTTFKDLLINDTNDYVAGRGWYTDANYIWSLVFDPRRAGNRVSGIYKVRVRPMSTQTPHPISRFLVRLDPSHTRPGTVLYDIATGLSRPVELSINTTTLSNGWHSIHALTESAGQTAGTCSVCSGTPQTHAGATRVWFYVQN